MLEVLGSSPNSIGYGQSHPPGVLSNFFFRCWSCFPPSDINIFEGCHAGALGERQTSLNNIFVLVLGCVLPRGCQQFRGSCYGIHQSYLKSRVTVSALSRTLALVLTTSGLAIQPQLPFSRSRFRAQVEVLRDRCNVELLWDG